ncbi:MAG: 50S ribosomal protein L18 [Candidatus Omnitrophica bacterium]|nr:50S ribosomal protein L18 [Candidatus Omnitrophota bacterium]
MQRKRVLQSHLRHERLRKKIIGTAQKPRLCVYRSLKNLSAQLVNDTESKTIMSLSTYDKDVKSGVKYGGNVPAAENLGKLFAQQASKKGIKQVVFDRGGRKYHGRVKAFAESCRKNGLDF